MFKILFLVIHIDKPIYKFLKELNLSKQASKPNPIDMIENYDPS